VWLCPQQLRGKLDAATWLDTTSELRKLGWKVTLVTAGAPTTNAIAGTDILCIPKPDVYFVGQFIFHLRFFRLVRRSAVSDVLLFHQVSALWMLLLRLVLSLFGKQRPYFVLDTRTLHMAREDKSSLKDKLRGQFMRLMNRLVNYWVDGQVVITPRMAEVLHIPTAQLWGCWPSGVNLPVFAPALTARQWPGLSDTIHVIYVGSLNYERNLMTLCRAVQAANALGMNFKLTLVGSGTEQRDLEAFANSTLGWLRVLPAIPHEDVPALLASAHVGVLAFPDEEKFRVSSPIKLFEYMAAGLPILATRIACHTDVIGDGHYVFWAKDASETSLLEGLSQIEAARDMLCAMGKEASVAAQAWTWERSAKKLQLALESGMARGAVHA
jgi:glycosyltransferase involved in cell wall biosynthesis